MVGWEACEEAKEHHVECKSVSLPSKNAQMGCSLKPDEGPEHFQGQHRLDCSWQEVANSYLLDGLGRKQPQGI